VSTEPAHGIDDEPEYYDQDDDYCCPTCNGLGYIITCCDDICANSDRCIHGDGEEMCPDCHGGM